MKQHAVLISIPGLRTADLELMPRLSALAADGGGTRPLAPSFPCVTLPVQVAMATGVSPREHGVVANGFYWRDGDEVEMWTAWNSVVAAPQIWDRLHEADPAITSAAWFPMWAKGCGADFICVPAPKHNPDGTESLWCYTRPEDLYPQLLDELGHFPLMNFWGPLANISSNAWIVDSAIRMARQFRPRFSWIYLPHLDNVLQKFGPDSQQSQQAWREFDTLLGRLIDGYAEAGLGDALWIAAGEYAITPVDGSAFPNRRLRENGFLAIDVAQDGTETLNTAGSRAWALVDHQLAHVFVPDAADVSAVAELFRKDPQVAEVLVGEERAKYAVDHERSGEIVLISDPRKWFAYYWWLDDAKAPPFARTVDIHRKPGYDPVELFIDPPTKSIPLEPALVRGAHGCPADDPQRQTVLVCSDKDVLPAGNALLRDRDVAGLVLRNFGVET